MEQTIFLPFKNSSFPAYFLTQEKKPRVGIILIHEIWGINDHMKDVAKRFLKENYTVLAPDLLSGTSLEGKFNESVIKALRRTKSREEAAKIMGPILDIVNSSEFEDNTVKKLKICFNYLNKKGISKIAVVGFCFGGTYSFLLATEEPRLCACVPFYGHSPKPLEKVTTIACPTLAFYGKKDTALIEAIPQLKEVLKKYDKQFQIIVYPNCGHAFFNDTNPSTYNKKAADDSWKKMLTFLSKYLK